MTTDLPNLDLFIGLVTFEKGDDLMSILSEFAEGAVGWMAGKAQNSDQFTELLKVELAQIGLKLLEVEDIEMIDDLSDVTEFDEHLASNMKIWEPGRMTVWGTLHQYIGEGEA